MLDRELSELGGCRLIGRIGAGGMGEVYLAEQVRLGNRLVAVKVVHAEQDISLPDGAAEDAERHFIREAQLLGRLTHPNILPVYHSGIEAGYRFLVMQYAPDGSLADAIKGTGPHRLDLPASLPFVVDIIGQVADALQYTHGHGVIHADVKPGNVLAQVEPDGRWHVLLADFGIAHSGDTVATRNEVAGTAAYMAPEQFHGQVSPACDQYALGVMAFQLLAGRLPFVGGLVKLVQAHERENPPALRALNPAVPPSVEAVIARALAKQPDDRHPSVAAFAEALRAASMGASTIIDASTRAVGAPLPGLLEDRPSAATSRTAPAATWNQPPAAPVAPPPRAPLARPEAAGPTATAREKGGARRRTATGVAVLALLLLAGLAAVGLKYYTGVGLGSAAPGAVTGTGQTPAVTATATGTSPTPLPNSGSSAQGTSTERPASSPAPTPTAPPDGQPNTATATPQPTQPTATPRPQPTDTAAPQPTSQPTSSSTLPPTPPSLAGSEVTP